MIDSDLMGYEKLGFDNCKEQVLKRIRKMLNKAPKGNYPYIEGFKDSLKELKEFLEEKE